MVVFVVEVVVVVVVVVALQPFSENIRYVDIPTLGKWHPFGANSGGVMKREYIEGVLRECPSGNITADGGVLRRKVKGGRRVNGFDRLWDPVLVISRI